MTAFARYSSTTGIATATYARPTKSPSISKLTSGTSFNACCSCRDPDGGYARYVCPGCQYEHRVPFSCKTRFCPSCGKVRVDNWVNDIAKDMFDVPHLQVTLTTDDLLRLFFYADRSLLKLLLQVAAQAVREVVDDIYPGLRIGMVYTVHTFGRDLGFKPHVHLVTPVTTAGAV